MRGSGPLGSLSLVLRGHRFSLYCFFPFLYRVMGNARLEITRTTNNPLVFLSFKMLRVRGKTRTVVWN